MRLVYIYRWPYCRVRVHGVGIARTLCSIMPVCCGPSNFELSLLATVDSPVCVFYLTYNGQLTLSARTSFSVGEPVPGYLCVLYIFCYLPLSVSRRIVVCPLSPSLYLR